MNRTRIRLIHSLHLNEVNAAAARYSGSHSSIPESSPHKQKEEIAPRCPSDPLQVAASFSQSPAAVAAEGSAAPPCVHAFLLLQQPVHAKAGSRWPEPLNGRYAVVSLLSSLAQDLGPA